MSTALSERVSDRIKQMICSGEYLPGEKLPNEQELMDTLNVSRSTVREAIKQLESQNILTIQRGVGTYVSEVPGLMEDPFGLLFIPEMERTLDLLNLRLMIEPHVAAELCSHITEEELQELTNLANETERCFEQMSQNPSNQLLDAIANTDIAFHEKLFSLSTNVVLQRLTPLIRMSLSSSWMNRQYRDLQALTYNINSHMRIVELIRQNEPEKLKEACEEHIRRSIRKMLGKLNET